MKLKSEITNALRLELFNLLADKLGENTRKSFRTSDEAKKRLEDMIDLAKKKLKLAGTLEIVMASASAKLFEFIDEKSFKEALALPDKVKRYIAAIGENLDKDDYYLEHTDFEVVGFKPEDCEEVSNWLVAKGYADEIGEDEIVEIDDVIKALSRNSNLGWDEIDAWSPLASTGAKSPGKKAKPSKKAKAKKPANKDGQKRGKGPTFAGHTIVKTVPDAMCRATSRRGLALQATKTGDSYEDFCESQEPADFYLLMKCGYLAPVTESRYKDYKAGKLTDKQLREEFHEDHPNRMSLAKIEAKVAKLLNPPKEDKPKAKAKKAATKKA